MRFRDKILLGLLLAGFLLAGSLVLLNPADSAVAHHNAPNDYNLTVGQLNEEMVHYGTDTVDHSTGALDNGSLHWSIPWVP